MARISTRGLDEEMARLKSIERGLRGEAMTAALMAGAEVLRNSWVGVIDERHRRTGAMMRSVGITDPKPDGNGMSVEVYPMGTDTHRINNAQKAYILHYGRQPTRKGTKEIKGDRFVSEAERKAKAEALSAMQKALDEYISGK